MNDVSAQECRDAIETQVCPWCGKGPWIRLSKHTHHAHGYGADDLRLMANLPEDFSTCSKAHTEQVIEANKMISYESRAAAGRAGIAARDSDWQRENGLRALAIGNARRKAKPICDLHGNDYVRERKNRKWTIRECAECEKARQREVKADWWRQLKERAASGDTQAVAELEHVKQRKRKDRRRREASRKATA